LTIASPSGQQPRSLDGRVVPHHVVVLRGQRQVAISARIRASEGDGDMATTRASEKEIDAALKALPGWARVEGRSAITKRFTFADFSEAWGFMARLALVAEQMNHHPEWFNVWNRVDVTLSTHDAGGISELDFNLATAAERLAKRG
jgi:4a-hydroxytetrahydrobiopterin dehydratase